MNPKIYSAYLSLLEKHGNPTDLWPQWCAQEKDEPLRQLVAIGAILVQRTSWRNADLALRKLKTANLLSFESLASEISPVELADHVKSAGFHQTKPKRLIALAEYIGENYQTLSQMKETREIETLREQLLQVYGIGPETADTILLYALDMPSFVIDEYTRRWLEKTGLTDRDLPYDEIKTWFEDSLPPDVGIYQNYHILVMVDQKGREASVMGVV